MLTNDDLLSKNIVDKMSVILLQPQGVDYMIHLTQVSYCKGSNMQGFYCCSPCHVFHNFNADYSTHNIKHTSAECEDI